MKKIISIIAIAALMLNITACKGAENFTLTMQIDNPIMTINGMEKEIDKGRGTAPVIINDRTLVPIRAIIEEMGGTVHWEDATQNVIIALGENIIFLTIDNSDAFVNSDKKTLDTKPAIINERTMLPIRFISENLGYEVNWNNNKQLITITKN